MIDIHSHLLSGLDEGVKTTEECLEICRYLSDNGFNTIVTTPHIISGLYNNNKNTIIPRLQEVSDLIKQANINIKLLPGAEYYMDFMFYKNLEEPEKLLTLNNKNKYILVELPMAGVPNPGVIKDIAFKLRVNNIHPVLAHPERYGIIIDKPERAKEFEQMGFILQMNLGSLNGGYGSQVKRTAEKLLDDGIIYCTALDIHSMEQARACVEKGIPALKQIVGEDGVKTLLQDNPAVLVGE